MSATAIIPGFPSTPAAIRLPARRRGMVVAMAAAAPAAAKAAGGKGLYMVLGVGEGASTGEIKAAYRTLAKRWHPDVAGERGTGIFLQIQEAYATLSDPTARQSYDRSMGCLGIGLGFRRVGRSCATKRWETDQCW